MLRYSFAPDFFIVCSFSPVGRGSLIRRLVSEIFQFRESKLTANRFWTGENVYRMFEMYVKNIYIGILVYLIIKVEG